jgi:alkylation response protein AidB-like acyl-CoA dehydrogenase
MHDASRFRSELASWLARELTPEVRSAGACPPTRRTLDVLRDWNRRLADAGWAAPAWPAEYGGRDADLDEQIAHLEEMSRAGAPGPINVIGVANIAPAILAHGTDEQRTTHLRPMLRGDEIWSQGMSEPDAGSDLASLRCRAVRDGDEFVIDGQKTLNSLGDVADLCQLYVRTDPAAAKHKGISCLLVDLRTPGIEVRPLRTMAGDTSFSEIFFDGARVPASSLLGPLNAGWRVAMTTLSHERAGVARLHLDLARRLDQLLAEPAVAAALRDRRVRDRVAGIHSEIACMGWTVDRGFAAVRAGTAPGAADGSMTKLRWGRLNQRIAELGVDLVGGDGVGPDGPAPTWAERLASSRSSTIAGGTTEINLNIVAEHGLGLPKEPHVG